MRRAVSILMILGFLVGMVSVAVAGGGHHHGHESAVWWGLGAGVALGALGAMATRPYGPAYPPVVYQPPPPRTALYCWNPPGYYPQVPWCPQWQVVPLPY